MCGKHETWHACNTDIICVCIVIVIVIININALTFRLVLLLAAAAVAAGGLTGVGAHFHVWLDNAGALTPILVSQTAGCDSLQCRKCNNNNKNITNNNKSKCMMQYKVKLNATWPTQVKKRQMRKKWERKIFAYVHSQMCRCMCACGY